MTGNILFVFFDLPKLLKMILKAFPPPTLVFYRFLHLTPQLAEQKEKIEENISRYFTHGCPDPPVKTIIQHITGLSKVKICEQVSLLGTISNLHCFDTKKNNCEYTPRKSQYFFIPPDVIESDDYLHPKYFPVQRFYAGAV